jgi:hypothetical protein
MADMNDMNDSRQLRKFIFYNLNGFSMFEQYANEEYCSANFWAGHIVAFMQ